MTTSSCDLGTYICGDCDNSGMVNIGDVLYIANIVAGLQNAPVYGTPQFNACNVALEVVPDMSADVTLIDALWLARHLVGLVPLTCCVP